MKICKECEKKFGLLEKIYYTEDGEMYCTSCVKHKREEKKKDEGEYVELKDTPPQPPLVQEPREYAHVSIPADPPVVERPVVPPSPSSDAGNWEFKVVKLSTNPMEMSKSSVTIEKFEKVINRMGEDGWELVSVIPLNVLLMKSTPREEPAMIFKRIKKGLSVGY